MRAHLFQYDIAWEDPERNHSLVESLVADADVRPGDFLLLPEMFDTGFSLNIERTFDRDGSSRGFLARLAQSTGCWVQASLTIVGDDERGRNRALVFAPAGSQVAQYDKIHPFTFGREGERFTGGHDVTTFRWGDEDRGLIVCPAICYDLRFPELFREGLSQGAEVIAIGANWPSARHEHWRLLLRARAIENQSYVLAVNRCGSDPHLSYLGGSAAIDPMGETIAEAGDESCVLSVEVDPKAVREWREQFPAWRDRSPALGAGNAEKPAQSV